MNRLEYLTQLRQSLVDGGLGNDEINDAMEFYEEIFLDAGTAYEEQTAKNLGDPKELARQILIDNNIHADGKQEYTMENVIDNRNDNQQFRQPVYQNTENNSSKTVLILVIVLTAFIWFPILIGLVSAAFGVSIGIIAAVASIVIAGVGLMAGGIFTVFSVPPVGIALFGVGTFLLGLGSLILIPIIKGIWHLIVRFVNWIVGIFRRLLGTGTVKQNG